MTNQKNKFFTFCWSLLPGAGQMYLGQYKQGISVMAMFWGIISLMAWGRMELLLFILPVLWCYSFFRTHELRNMAPEKFAAVEDSYIAVGDLNMEQWEEMIKSHKKLVAAILIFFGVCVLGDLVMSLLSPFLYGVIWELAVALNRNFVRIAVALSVIITGVYLLRNKKEAVQEEEVVSE